MRSNLISKKETNVLLDTVSSEWGIKIPKTKNLKMYMLGDGAQLITGIQTKILQTADGDYLPFLTESEMLDKFPSITVDMGAVKFMCKGANLMRPGIVSFTEFVTDSLVAIREESHGKYLAVGRTTVSSSEAASMQKGEIAKNLHYISDKFWEAGKTINS